MPLEDVFYSIGEGTERLARMTGGAVKNLLFPSPSERPPQFRLLKKLARRDLTPHELLSLTFQLVFIAYLAGSFMVIVLRGGIFLLLALYLAEIVTLRVLLGRYQDFLVTPEPYGFFYYGISTLSLVSFAGYSVLRRVATGLYQYYAYLALVAVAVIVFRWYFKRRFGREYTYGVVEEVKSDMVQVFIHDDIAANVKPGRYWLPAVPDAEPGRVVKILVEDRPLRSARPIGILEVYLEGLDQSSQTEIEPKEEAE